MPRISVYTFACALGLGAALPSLVLGQDAAAPEFIMPSESDDIGAAIDVPEPQAVQEDAGQSEMPTREDGRIQSGFTAKLRVMNRKLEKNADLAIPANQTKRYDTLNITPITCMRDAQGVRDNDMVYLRIQDEGREVFNGWMSQQFPGISLLQHPHYSVIVLGCN